MTAFEVVLAARVSAQLVAPTMTVVDRLVCETISYTDELNRPGGATLGCPIGSMSDAVKGRLALLAATPSEAWIYADSDLVWAGEIQTLAVRDQTVDLGCVGLLGYTYRMGLTADLTYAAVDQFTIGKGLVDHWQALDYGHYGLDTSGISTSGVTRDRTYLRDELHHVGQRLAELGAVIDGFDIHVNPSTRALTFSYPERGTDLADSVFLDTLNIDSAAVAMSVAPEDLVTDVSATGTAQSALGQSTTIYTLRSNTTLRSTYGRSFGSATFDGVSVAGTLDDHTDAYRDARNGQLFQPGVTIVPRIGCDVGDFGPGDLITYSYDAGLGTQSDIFRVAKVTTTVDSSGRIRLGVDFA